jgi:hypothetical protein
LVAIAVHVDVGFVIEDDYGVGGGDELNSLHSNGVGGKMSSLN